jgi:hypothetical protein
MSAKAVPRSRPEAQRPTTSARRAPYPAATNRQGYNSRQAPSSTYYSVEQLQNGQEVITIEDTPTPEPGAAAAGALASGSGARYGGGGIAEPATKRRKSDGVHISDNPYVASSSSSSRAKQPPPAYHANNVNGASASGSTSKNKRKHAHDPYEDYSDRSSARAVSLQPPSSLSASEGPSRL